MKLWKDERKKCMNKLHERVTWEVVPKKKFSEEKKSYKNNASFVKKKSCIKMGWKK